MVVPSVPLVEQQTTMLNRFFRRNFWLEGKSGAESIDIYGRAPYILASHICVFTPQVFMLVIFSFYSIL